VLTIVQRLHSKAHSILHLLSRNLELYENNNIYCEKNRKNECMRGVKDKKEGKGREGKGREGKGTGSVIPVEVFAIHLARFASRFQSVKPLRINLIKRTDHKQTSKKGEWKGKGEEKKVGKGNA